MDSSNENTQDVKNKVFFTRCTCAETTKEGLMGRCFITGDQCPHKKSIIAKKIKRHEGNKIKAFVIMSFTPITDALYQWMLKDLITSNLYGDTVGQDAFYLGDEKQNKKIDPKNIEIVRCDDSIYSSHIICESICSEIQESDLVVVDLSYQNPNVFYELGLAIALGKKILPICYLKTYYETNGGDQGCIRSFDWKRKLFEWFSISALDEKQYGDDKYFENYPFADPPENKRIGANLKAAFDYSLSNTNNLLLYDPRQSVQQSPGIISRAINQFSKIVDKVTQGIRQKGDPVYESMNSEDLETKTKGMLSRGDRIMLLHSKETIITEDKDKKDTPVSYDYGDVCRIAINQANYSIESNEQSAKSLGLERNMWNYVYNCTEVQNLDYPLFVDTIKERRFPELNFLFDGIPMSAHGNLWSFTYLDVILAKAQHCHTAMIDMRNNSINAFFWMGIFHGRGRFVVPIRYDNGMMSIAPENNSRVIADIAGLWNAYFQSKAPENFSQTVRKVLNGINQKSEHLGAWQKAQFLRSINAWTYQPEPSDEAEKDPCDMSALDRYYRELFWNVLLAHGDVSLYPASYKATHRATVSHWDYNAIARIENFSNQRIGAFRTVLRDTLGIDSEEMESIRFPKIVLGDREVNKVTRQEIAQVKDQVFQLRKCDVAFERLKNPEENAWSQCDGIDCDMYLSEEGRCAAPPAKLIRGFAKKGTAEWMADFPSDRALGNKDELAEMDLTTLYGQLIFLRHKGSQFSILLEGASGPATFALADLLSANMIATEDAKKRSSDTENNPKIEIEKTLSKKDLLFYTLQEEMLVRCKNKLEEIRNNILATPDVIYQAEFFAPAANYLMLCLCDRFLPTTSERFVQDLNTRMHLFLTQLRKDTPAFGKTEEQIGSCFNTIFQIFGEWFEWFKTVRGIAVIIKIGINRDPIKREWDNRWPDSVKIAMDTDGCDGADKKCFSIIYGKNT